VIRTTYTLAELELSPAAYEEIAAKLLDAGYDHAFSPEGMIDMSGIGITRKKPTAPTAPRICTVCHTPEGLPHRYRHIPKYAEVV
jgi:hypothetical protein